MENQNNEELASFTTYCQAHPNERFWQALRNWNQKDNPDENFILTASIGDVSERNSMYENLKDTFYRD